MHTYDFKHIHIHNVLLYNLILNDINDKEIF